LSHALQGLDPAHTEVQLGGQRELRQALRPFRARGFTTLYCFSQRFDEKTIVRAADEALLRP